MAKDWAHNKVFDNHVKPEAYITWRDRALDHLARDRLDVRHLLLWAEKEKSEMSLEMVAQKIRATGITEIAETLNHVRFGAIKAILGDTLLDRARLCESNGLELWRRLHVEWEGAAPLVISAKARVWQDPHRCSSVLQLWDTLGNWERLGAEIALGGYDLPDDFKAIAFEKLIPPRFAQAAFGENGAGDLCRQGQMGQRPNGTCQDIGAISPLWW